MANPAGPAEGSVLFKISYRQGIESHGSREHLSIDENCAKNNKKFTKLADRSINQNIKPLTDNPTTPLFGLGR